jgi:hypothetical protein
LRACAIGVPQAHARNFGYFARWKEWRRSVRRRRPPPAVGCRVRRCAEGQQSAGPFERVDESPNALRIELGSRDSPGGEIGHLVCMDPPRRMRAVSPW